MKKIISMLLACTIMLCAFLPTAVLSAGAIYSDTAHHKTPRVRASGGGESVGSLEGDRET